MSQPVYDRHGVQVHHGDCLAVLRTMPDESIAAVITDPPYGLSDHKPVAVVAALTAWANGDREQVPDGKGFMNRSWDSFVPPPAVWDECMRVLKPGGHLVAFAGSRTYDLMGLSIRMAGFEIRDGLTWLYGSGMPKGQNVEKSTSDPQWEGWNTSLKPAQEPIVLARKPIRGTVAANVISHGTGALNVDATRTGGNQGRWPTNALLTHAEACAAAACVCGCPVAELDAQSTGTRAAKPSGTHTRPGATGTSGIYGAKGGAPLAGHDGSGGARFFPTFRYQAKAPDSERPKIDGKGWPTVKPQGLVRWIVRLVTPPGGKVLDPFAGTMATGQAARDEGFASIMIERDPFACQLGCQRLDARPRTTAGAVVTTSDEPMDLLGLLEAGAA
jgi:DNA modification methylase